MVSPGFYKRLSVVSLLLIIVLLTLLYRSNSEKFVQFEKPQAVKSSPKAAAPVELPGNDEKMLQKIREMARHSWSSYKRYSWGDDELLPLTKSGKNWTTYSYLFTPVDSLDTLFIMGLEKEYQECKDLVISKLNFDIDPDKTMDKFNHFEITIRVLGGLLSVYELDPDKRFLDLAVDLGNRLIGSFDKVTGIPAMWFNIGAGTSSSSSGLLSTFGTVQLELQYLSDVTGNPIYQDKALAIFDYLRSYKLPIKGLYPTYLNVRTGKFDANYRYSIANDADSFYEYILKIWISTGEERFREMFEESADALIKNLLVNSPSGEYAIFSDGVGDLNKEFHHLSCFTGGMYTLAGATRKTNRWTEYLDVGRRVTDTCYAMYKATSHGLGAEVAAMRGDKIEIVRSTVSLRPETIESIFYQYRVTNDQKYRNWGEKFVDSLNRNAKTEAGFHSLENGVPFDRMESFFIAETLKYLYLLFCDSRVISLKEYVFNTEAHPFSIRGNGQRSDPKKWVKIKPSSF